MWRRPLMKTALSARLPTMMVTITTKKPQLRLNLAQPKQHTTKQSSEHTHTICRLFAASSA